MTDATSNPDERPDSDFERHLDNDFDAFAEADDPNGDSFAADDFDVFAETEPDSTDTLVAETEPASDAKTDLAAEPASGPVPVSASDQVAPSPEPDPEPVADLSTPSLADLAETPGSSVPDGPPPRWTGTDYGAALFGRGADKVASSAVAPLVAVARGYVSFDHTNLDEAWRDYPLPARNKRQGKTLVDSMRVGDVLIMPWYTPDDVEQAARRGLRSVASTIQYRPSHPAVNEKGKELKYEFVGGQHSPIGAHPAMPIDWFDTIPRVLVAEGLLKGDAALTGMLLDAGVSFDVLSDTHGGDRDTCTAVLRTLIQSIPEDKRILILTIGGVWSWMKNHEWRSLPLRDREVWVGIDGDVAENPKVYMAATRLWEYIRDYQKAKPALLTPTVTGTDAGGIEKIGIDDYLAEVGTWSSLLAMLSPDLPPPPKSNNLAHVDTHRMSVDGTALELCKPKADPFTGETIDGTWETVIPLGGRILSVVAERIPSELEIRTGRPEAVIGGDGTDTGCEVEIAWRDEAGKEERYSIVGPDTMLNYLPDQWHRHGARIPTPVVMNPDWPPRNKEGEAWLKALKENRRNDITTRIKWGSMGWVPVANGTPAFIIGDTVIGAEDSDAEIIPGVGEAELANASRFGVSTIDTRPFTDESYRAEVRRDIEKVIDTYIRAGAFTDRAAAAVVLAAGIRPTLPLRPKVTVYFTGPPRKGKSAAAAWVMGFWSRRPGDWTSHSLPGSAKDTLTSMEMSIARTPIWVLDDLAPATSLRQSQAEQDRLGDIIRSVFNGEGKGRATADMGSRKRFTPRSMLLVTAENEPQVGSVRDRTITVDIGYGALNPAKEPTDALDALCGRNGAPARVAQAMIKFLRHTASASPSYTWEDLHKEIRTTYERCQDVAREWLKNSGAQEGDAKRAADLAADLNIALSYLAELAAEVGCDDETIDLLSMRGISGDIASLVARGHEEKNETTAGNALITALTALLRSGKAHIENLNDVKVPPTTGTDSTEMASALGWKPGHDGSLRPMGESIGVFGVDKKTGTEVVLFDRRLAFNAAQRHFPELLPHGQAQRSSWGSVIGEGLAVTKMLRSGNSGKTLNSARLRSPEGLSHSGVPIALKRIIGADDPETDGEEQE